MRRLVFGISAVALLGCVASPAGAQYFGRNKVQYQNLDFRVLQTEHFDIYFYPSERAAADIASRMAERWYTRLSSVLDHTLSGRQPLILYASQSQFQQTNAIPGELGEGTGGVTEALRRRIVLPTGGTLGDLDHVIGHELVHAFQYDMTGSGPGIAGAPAATALPLWFMEGMAEYLSLGPKAPLTAMWMRGALQDSTGDSLPTFGQLEDPRFFPYRYGHAFLAFIAGHWGDQAMGQLLRATGRSADIGSAIGRLFQVAPESLVARWHAETRAAFGPLERTTRPPQANGRPLIVAKGREVQYNVAPALSPDGSQVMFFSNRGLLSIDLFLADAHTGRIKRQVTSTAVDPHLQSLQFIQSAGSWSADGQHFAFGALSGGRPMLTLYDVGRGRVEREIRLSDLDEIVNPGWSPDGRMVVFSGLSGGLTDLFVYDLQTDQLTRLTDDPFADLQPAWSPDGRTIAFATDRFTTNLDPLAVGGYRLALLDVATKQVRQPSYAASVAAAGVKQLNPQWSPDGRALYFLSDPDGITNVYRLDLASGELTRVTDLFTGVSGITETSPAISVAQRSGQLVFTAFRANGHELYVIDDAGALAGKSVGAPAAERDAAISLPPRERVRPQLPAFLADPTIGLPPAAPDSVRRYGGRLGLTYIGRPTLVAGTSRFGTFVGGGAALYFSDILGNRNLLTELQVYGNFKDLLAMVAYQNLAHRMNWGVVAQQFPYLAGGYGEGFADLNGRTVFVQQELIDRQIDRDVYGLASYPFNQVQRLDFSLGYSNVSFSRELRTLAYDPVTGQLVLDQSENLPAASALNQVVGSAALVYDNSFFGATSPILGQRYRLELGGTTGTLNYADVLADYRRYLLPVRPFTVAVRLLHYGRYGSGGEDPRLQPLFLGYPGLVRGYTYGSFDPSECNAPTDTLGTCPVFDQLLGSRIAVASAELRFPLFGLLGIGSGYYGALPIEALAFTDAGLAWDTADKPRIFGLKGVREPVRSAGFGLRMNFFGFAIGQLDLVRPFDRPEKGWIWQFELQPGF